MNFDVLVSSYEDDIPIVAHEKVFQIPGNRRTKVEGFSRLLRDYGDFIAAYRLVAFIDDDVAADAETLSQCFELGDELGLQIWQPALSHDSYFTYAALLRNPAYAWRYVNFIEMMCPFFSREKLAQVAFLYDQGYESGIDLIWCNVGRSGSRSFAVLDCCCVKHTRPVGGEMAKNGFVSGRSYETDIEKILGDYNAPWLSCIPYACVGRDGRIISSRLGMFLRSIPLLASVLKASFSTARMRAVVVYWKHLLTRRAENCQIALAGERPQKADK